MDYLDLLLIHWPGAAPLKPDDPANTTIRLETWKALIELKKSNKVRDIGVSNFMLPHLCNELVMQNTCSNTLGCCLQSTKLSCIPFL